MGARAQIQETVRNLLNSIIEFNESKRKEYNDLCFDIQRHFYIDDYVDMHFYLENCCGSLKNNDEALNELPDADLITLAQHLEDTAEFIGLNANNIQSGTGSSSVRREAPASNFSSQMQLLLYFIDMPRIHKDWPKDREILQFFLLTAQEQMEFLKRYHKKSVDEGGRAKGNMAALFRHLRREMKLRELFSLDQTFMNVELRDFLNVNAEGEDRYTLHDMKTSGWSETNSIGSKYHQNLASDRRVTAIIAHNKNGPIEFKWIYNRLNAKFTNTDGREAVFSHPGVHINSGIDKGTFNYSVLKHWEFDVEPFERNHSSELSRYIDERYNIGFWGNRHYWHY